ncbi:MAG: UbiX family flavin prenyltransferase [Thermoplasmatales archaeon]|nr:UbiX family flavin prenyltransferase [Thermoplasmatales archaeon]
MMRIVIGITGASGIIYGVRLLEKLKEEKYLVVSENAKKIMEHETGYKPDHMKKLSEHYYENNDLFPEISSGSFMFDAMVIVPCSMSTLSKIASGISDSLITRTAAVCMKEKRKLVLVPRETPISTIHLQNMAKLSENNVIILPAAPGFYPKPKNVDDIVNFVVGKIMDCLGIENTLYKRWGKLRNRKQIGKDFTSKSNVAEFSKHE